MWGWEGRGEEDPAARRLCSDMPGATYFFQRSNEGVEIDSAHPQIGEGLKYFQITEFLSLLSFFQVSVTQLCQGHCADFSRWEFMDEY